MAFINKHDTNGTKGLLAKGELGYDDYSAGGDTGRVYVGTGTENIALADRLEANMMTKAQFNALAEERKANRAGSGFDEWGKHAVSTGNYPNINEGMFVSILNSATYNGNIKLGYTGADKTGVSKTNYPIVNVNGVSHRVDNGEASNNITLPTAPTIYPYDTVLTAEQIASGVIKHADASNSGLIVNGKFDDDTSGWTAYASILSVDSGRLKITSSDTQGGRARQVINTIVGKEYIVESLQENGTSENTLYVVPLAVYSTSGALLVTQSSGRFTATTTTTSLLIVNSNTTASTFSYADNIAVYPADAISRSDLSFLESWHEDIGEKNFAYDNGNTQSLMAINTIGVVPVNGAFTGFETYSLFGNWQTPSSLIGKGYVWSSLTEAQKRAFIANPDNNCYLDGDKVIQVRYRVRVVQGLGDNWNDLTNTYSGLFVYSSLSLSTIIAKGKNVSIASELGSNTTNTYFTNVIDVFGQQEKSIGAYTARKYNGSSISEGYANKCFALPIALVHRRNQGAYHPVYNANGTKKASDSNFWYNTAVSFASISDCFDPAKLLTASGYIGTVSGRPDGLFYDQIHESDILDLRNSSKKVEDYNRLIGREFNKLVAGTYRGKEGEWNTIKERTQPATATHNYIYLPHSGYESGQQISWFDNLGNMGTTVLKGALSDGGGQYWSTTNSVVKTINEPLFVTKRTTRTKSNTLLHCDIIGNPANYPIAWKESGVSGTPLIVAEDGTSLLPNGTLDTFKLSRKANATPLLCLRSTDNGATWTSFAPTFSTTTNAITLTDEPAANLVMVYYQTHTSMAVPVTNSEVLEYGKVLGIDGLANAHLVSTLIRKVPTANTAPYLQMGYDVNSYRIDASTFKFSTTATEIPLHSALSLAGGASGVPAVKVLPYLTRSNGKAYLNLVFKEMKHNGTSFGDDNKFNIVDNVSTITDLNAQTVLIGQKTVELPYFIGADE